MADSYLSILRYTIIRIVFLSAANEYLFDCLIFVQESRRIAILTLMDW